MVCLLSHFGYAFFYLSLRDQLRQPALLVVGGVILTYLYKYMPVTRGTVITDYRLCVSLTGGVYDVWRSV